MNLVRLVSRSALAALLLTAAPMPMFAQTPAAAPEPPKPACTNPDE